MKIEVTRQEVVNLWIVLQNLTSNEENALQHPLKLAYPLGRTKRFITGDVEDIQNAIKLDDEYLQKMNEIQERHSLKDADGNPRKTEDGKGYLLGSISEYYKEMAFLKEEMGINRKQEENLEFLKEKMEINVEFINFEDLPDEMNLDDISALDIIITPPSK
jgi:hypothetical protein